MFGKVTLIFISIYCYNVFYIMPNVINTSFYNDILYLNDIIIVGIVSAILVTFIEWGFYDE